MCENRRTTTDEFVPVGERGKRGERRVGTEGEGCEGRDGVGLNWVHDVHIWKHHN
jgi:hypothetical protein